jgi:hypothetical protein
LKWEKGRKIEWKTLSHRGLEKRCLEREERERVGPVVKMAMGLDPRFPAGNFLIRGRGCDPFTPHGDLFGRKSIPIGSGGDGMGSITPYPIPANPTRLEYVVSHHVNSAHQGPSVP